MDSPLTSAPYPHLFEEPQGCSESHPVGKDETSNTGFSLCAVSQNGTHIVKLACRPPAGHAGLGRPACRLGRPVLPKTIAHLVKVPRGSNTPDPVDIDGTNPQCFLSLTNYPAYSPKKDPNVFYHLRTLLPVTTSVFYHLQKRGWGAALQNPCIGRAFDRPGNFTGLVLGGTSSLSPANLLNSGHL
jgi:hypothetical protein